MNTLAIPAASAEINKASASQRFAEIMIATLLTDADRPHIRRATPLWRGSH